MESEQPAELKRIVVVGADAASLSTIRGALEPFGHIRSADDEAQAMRQCTALPAPRLVLVDGTRPDIDALELTQRLKRSPHTRHIPVILVMGRSEPGALIAGINAGARAFVNKPLRKPVLRAKVRRALGMPQPGVGVPRWVVGSS